MPKLYAATNPEMSVREKKNLERVRKVASQGMVLLENNGVLPLREGTGNIALFGNGARRTVKGGTGSGDVNIRAAVNVEQGLEDAGYVVTTKQWLDGYDQYVESKREEYFAALKAAMAEEGTGAIMRLMTDPFIEPPVTEVTQEDIADSRTDTAIYVLARNSGEGQDRNPSAGEYELYEEEKEAITCLAAGYGHLVVVLNVGGVIDTKFLRGTQGIDAILLMGQAGSEGGHALADVLTGKVNPGGRLTATWADNYLDYPGADMFSHVGGGVDDEYYKEGIYVGYRYFDTFDVTPAYPFGYGKSYTSFSISTEKVSADAENITLTVSVTNDGDVYSGREVVQVYYSAPSVRLEKPYQELAAYAKTKELAPKESQMLTLCFPIRIMASYDEEQAGYILEPGRYDIRVGRHSRDTHIVCGVMLDQEVMTEKLSNKMPIDCEMDLLSSKEVNPYTYPEEETERGKALLIPIYAADITCMQAEYRSEYEPSEKKETEESITIQDVMEGLYTLDDLVSQLTVEEMANLCVGTARDAMGGQSVIGAASAACPGAAGDTTSLMIETRDIRNMILADGPAGLRLCPTFLADADNNLLGGGNTFALPGIEYLIDMPEPEIPEGAVTYYQYCTAIPIATLLAQSWDADVVEEAGAIVGEEMEELGIHLWLAPGMNIQRNPLCGRNFEYYSEDPLVSGICAAADTKGVQKFPGQGTTIKHFACNNQEDNRMHTNAHVSERALREIYLKGFEYAVKTSQPMSIMTSYNLVNGVHTANSYDLLTAIARDEWGFQGIVMTDWGTTGSMEMEPGKTFKYGCSNAAGCVKAGNDLTMPGCQNDVDEIIRSVGAAENDVECPITLGDLQACAKRMLSVIMKSSAYNSVMPY